MQRTAVLGCFLVGAVALLFSALPAGADDAATGPVTYENIKEMRKEKVAIKQIMERIEQRGLGFEVDAAAERKLRSIGFSPKQVATLKGMKAEPVEQAPAAQDAGKPAGKGAKPAGVPRVLSAATENEYAEVAERVKKIVATSNTVVKAHPTPHITLISNPNVAAKALPDLQQVQKLLAQRFPEPLATGIDPRAANIALLESRYEYERWIRALYKVHEEAGLKFEGVDPLATMLKTNSIFVKGIFSVCLEGMDAESIRRRLAFSVGYQYMEQMTDNKGPDALRTGFGNLAEVMMFREPTMTVQSGYNPRNLNLQGPRWADMVRQRFAQNKVESLGQALNYSTRSMTLEEYADAWSLAEFLASEPRNMAELSTALEQGTDVAEALKKVYGLDDAGLMKHWRQFVLGKRQ